jgi:SAM-dependent methyltransferase
MALSGEVEFVGCDYDQLTIAWNQHAIHDVSFCKNSLAPPLPFPDGHFDCAYAISVFTHLSEAMHYAWAEELRRVVKDGGLIITSLHGDYYRDLDLTDTEKHLYDAGRIVIRGNVEEGKKWFTAYHSPKFVREKLFPQLTVTDHIVDHEFLMSDQDVWCFVLDSKPLTARPSQQSG